MTPQEKAVELYSKYVYQICNDNGISESDSVLLCARFCAFIAVDEIIQTVDMCIPYVNDETYVTYWNKVKQEIENL